MADGIPLATPNVTPMETPLLSLKKAAEMAGVSPATIRRRKADLQALGAVCEPSGWQIDPAHLVAVGLIEGVTAATPLQPPNVTPSDTPSNNDELVSELRGQLEHERARYKELREDFERERERADRAEKRADMLLVSAVQRLEISPTVEVVSEPDSEPETAQKSGFFSRLFKHKK